MLEQGSAEAAFTKQSDHFDELDRSNKLASHLRERVRKEVLKWHTKPADILELNCGTGIDAIYYASKGHKVFATDASSGMIRKLEEKLNGRASGIQCKLLSYHEVRQLKGLKFDHIVSNFGGLNCTGNLEEVLNQFYDLLHEKGKVTLVIMPKVCPWELIQVFKGKFRTAFRRLRGKTVAKVEGISFECFYYNPSFIIRRMRKDFEIRTLKGLFICVPPEFYTGFVERYPRLYKRLAWLDDRISGYFPFNRCCDHFMITLEKK